MREPRQALTARAAALARYKPIPSAGGLRQESGTDEVTAAVEAARQAGVIGVSMYSWSGVKPGQLVSMQEEPR